MMRLLWKMAEDLGWPIVSRVAAHYRQRHDLRTSIVSKLPKGAALTEDELVEFERANRQFGWPRAIIAAILLAPLVIEYLVFMPRVVAAAQNITDTVLSDPDGWLDYGHIVGAIVVYTFGRKL